MRTLSFLLTMLLPLAVSAQDTFTPQHVAKLRIVTEAVIAPDGTFAGLMRFGPWIGISRGQIRVGSDGIRRKIF